MPTQLERSRALAFDRQHGRCYYCSVQMWRGAAQGDPRLRCTAEHLVLRSLGGADTSDNIVAACAHCNHTRNKRKRTPAPEAYRRQVMRRVLQGRWHVDWVHRSGLLAAHG